MNSYKIYHSAKFDSIIQKCDRNIQDWINHVEEKLASNPHYGKPLFSIWLREAKYGKYRLYYIVYSDLFSILIVAISNKKKQQETIETIMSLSDEFKRELTALLRYN